ncbi:hypothetical protein SAMN05660380_01248 [Xylella fastidiosa]|nr:hypothetical protein SAMN05660380_01248 [Xylella fastidiosa]
MVLVLVLVLVLALALVLVLALALADELTRYHRRHSRKQLTLIPGCYREKMPFSYFSSLSFNEDNQ